MAKSKGTVREVHEKTYGEERDKTTEATTSEIIKKFGKGSIMRYGDDGPDLEIEAIPTGSLALDAALGIGGVPRGRIIEIYGPESSGKTTLSLEILAEAQAMGGVVAFIDAEHALDPGYAARIGVDIDEVLISQPDTGEQALEICDMLVRSGAIDVVVVDSVAAPVPRAETRARSVTRRRRFPGAPYEPGPQEACRLAGQVKDDLHLHQPASREDWRHVRQPRDHAWWPCSLKFFFGGYGHSAALTR